MTAPPPASQSPWPYALTIFLGASLLFVIEPVAAKALLPVLGGSSSVWLTCLCFFQVALLAGYGYAYLVTGAWLRRARLLGLLHCALLVAAAVSLLALRHGITGPATATTHPALAIFLGLARTVGLPFLLLSTTSPLLQVWIAHRSGRGVPYRLFALSNVASLLALLAYPLLIEPNLTLAHQRLAWSVGFLVYAVLCGGLALRPTPVPQQLQPTPAATEPDTQPTATRWLWFGLGAAAAMQLCAVTSHLTVNVAAIPLLWILPLAVYLFSFVLAFELPGLYRRGIVVRLLVVMLASLGYLLSKTDVSLPISLSITFFVVELFCACWFAHAEVYGLRPAGARAAARFYLILAGGGAAGTLFIAVLSPLLFRANYDLPLSFAVTAALATAVTWRDGWPQRLLWGVSTVLCFALVYLLYNGFRLQSVANVRNFYGSLRVKQTEEPPQAGTARTLLHGSIKHGMQWFSDEYRHEPTTYYARDSGVGLAIGYCCDHRPRRIGVIGLGAGTVAAYGRPGDTIRFYEINPLVLGIAHDLFTYLRESPAAISIAEGDARVSLTHEPPQNFDVLVVDAFSGDAIPVHLLTVEALRQYRRHMAPGGIIAFHVSNQYLELAPVIRRLAQAEHMVARVVDSPGRDDRGEFAARWVLVSDTDQLFNREELSWAALPIEPNPHLRLWTDDYSSLLPIVRWGKSNWW